MLIFVIQNYTIFQGLQGVIPKSFSSENILFGNSMSQ